MAVPDFFCAPPINARARATDVFTALFCPGWFTKCEFRRPEAVYGDWSRVIARIFGGAGYAVTSPGFRRAILSPSKNRDVHTAPGRAF
jgi:hypothetical protein